MQAIKPTALVAGLVLYACAGPESAEDETVQGDPIANPDGSAFHRVDCRVFSTASGNEFKGECKLAPTAEDSFWLSRMNEQPFFGRTLVMIIEAETPTKGRLSILTSNAERVDYGQADRDSGTDPCWRNDSTDVCVSRL